MIDIVPATKDMMAGFFDGMEKVTVKAVAMIEDGEILAIGGTYKASCGHVLFMKASDKARRKPKALFKAAKQFAAKYPTVYAYCDTSIEGSDRFLKHLGLKKINGDVWRGSH